MEKIRNAIMDRFVAISLVLFVFAAYVNCLEFE